MLSGVLSVILQFLSLVVVVDAPIRHFHIIFFLPKYDGDDFADCLNLQYVLHCAVLSEWKRNYGSDRKPDWKPLCTYVSKMVRGKLRTNFDLHYVNPRLSDGGTADVGFYVLKYMLKPSDRAVRLQRALHLNLSEEEYNDIWNLVRPRAFYSKHFGLAGEGLRKDWKPSQKIIDYVVSSVQKSKGYSDFPMFFNPVDGNSFPLSRYYKNRGECFSVGDALDFHYGSRTARADNVVIPDDYDLNQVLTKEEKLQGSISDIDLKQDSNDLDDLYL